MGGNLSDDLIIRAIADKNMFTAVVLTADDDDNDDDGDLSPSSQPTIHGVCPTDYTINAREDIATDVSIRRDLSNCDMFSTQRQDVSPLAIISGMVRHQASISCCRHGNERLNTG